MSYSYNYDGYSSYPTYNSPRTRKPPSLWLMVLVFVIVALLQFCKRLCSEEQEEESRAQNQLDSPQTVPRVAVISEITNRQNNTRPVQFVCYSGTDEHDTAARRLADRLGQQLPNTSTQVPEASISNRFPIRSNSIPQYDSPPNYEEALALLNVNQKQKDNETPIT